MRNRSPARSCHQGVGMGHGTHGRATVGWFKVDVFDLRSDLSAKKRLFAVKWNVNVYLYDVYQRNTQPLEVFGMFLL